MNKRIWKMAASGVITCLLFSMTPYRMAKAAEYRYAGNDRIDTALKISQNGWKSKTDYAFIAAAEDEYLIDSLMAAPLAKAYDAPILINHKGHQLELNILEQLKKWEVKTVFVVSGEGALSKVFEKQLTDQNIKVVRLGNNDKRKTSINIAKALKDKTGKLEKAFVVCENSQNIVDALSVAPIAVSESTPVLLASKDEMSEDTRNFIKTSGIIDTYVIGGPLLISDKVMTSVNGVRIYGGDRFETNIKILDKFKSTFNMDKIYFSSGKDGNLVDAISGSVLAGKNKGPILLVGDSLSENTKKYIKDNVEEKDEIEIFGGYGAVTKEIEGKIDDIKNGEEDGIVKLESVQPINSTVVKVVLKRPREVTKDNFILKDEFGKKFEIKSVEKDSQEASSKTVYINFKDSTSSKFTYILNSMQFNGKDKDTTAPILKKVQNIDFNKVYLTFSEEVNIDKLDVSIKEQYGNGSSITIKEKKYVGEDKSKVELITEDQKESIIYKLEVSGAYDLEGNIMQLSKDFTIKGIGKDVYTKLEIEKAEPVSPRKIILTFNKAFNRQEGLKVQNYSIISTVSEILQINNIELANEGDGELSEDELRRSVVITLNTPMKDNELYNVIVNVGFTSSGVELNSSKNSYKFIGVGPYATKLDFTEEGNNVTALSNKKVRVTFKRPMNSATLRAENFNIYSLYNDPALKIINVKIINPKTVDLEVTPMVNSAYKLVVQGVTDVDGNAVEEKKNSKIFKGKEETSEIKSIVSTKFEDRNGTSLILTFDNAASDDAKNVEHYYIEGIGKPLKAEMVTENPCEVKLTLPQTVIGRLYKLTVTNIQSADGESMDLRGVSTSFVGCGISSTTPTIERAEAIDRQTIKIYFDRSVKDPSVDGKDKVWDSSNNRLSGNTELKLTGNSTENLNSGRAYYVSKDMKDEKALIVRADRDILTHEKSDNGKFRVYCDKAKSTSVYVESNNESPSKIKIEEILALDKNTIRVRFNQPTKITSTDFAKIATTEKDFERIKNPSYYSGASSVIRISKMEAIDESYTTYDLVLTGAKMSDVNYFVVNPYVSHTVYEYTGGNYRGFVTFEDEDSSTSGIQYTGQFEGSKEEPKPIYGLPVQMLDSKTIQISYPEKMDTIGSDSSVLNANNYKLVDKYGREIGVSFLSVQAVDMKYTKDNKVIISLRETLPGSENGYFIKFSRYIQNSLKTKNVRDPYNGMETVTQFTLNKAKPEGLRVSENSTYDYSSRALVINLNGKAISLGNYSKNYFMADFKVTVVDSDGNSYVLRDSDIARIDTAPGETLKTAGDTIKIILNDIINGNRTLKHGEVGKIEILKGGTLKAVNGETVEESSTIFIE